MRGLHTILLCIACVAMADGAVAAVKALKALGDFEMMIEPNETRS